MRAGKALNVCAALALGAAVLTPQAGFATDICADRSERTGLEMRVLQSELMVAALTCGQRADYNAFVATFKPQIKKHSAHLKAFFLKTYGNGGTTKLNRMVTRLANRASQNSLSQPTSAFCAQSKQRFERILAATPDQLTRIAHNNPDANAHGFRSCVEVADSAKASDTN